MLVALVGSRAQEFQLCPIPTAPFAEEQMKLKAKPFEQRKLPIHRLGLKTRGFFAAWGKERDSSSETS